VNVGHWRALTQRRAGFTDEAEASLRRIEDVTGSAGAGFAPREFIWACIAFDRGRHDEAVASVLKARGVTEDSGQFIGTMLVGTVSANILIGSGQHELGAEFLDRLRRQVTGPVTHHYLGAIELNAAWLAHRIGDLERRDDRLADALRLARDPLVRERLRWYPNALAELLPVAFERNVETGTAQALVRAFDIKASRFDSECWPWKIRIYTMGQFETRIDDKPLEFGRKAPKKTIALLKALVAFGGHEVSEEKLTDALWPGEEADTARQSLSAAVHRLRRLLGEGDAVRQSASALSLDRRICWVDALALDNSAVDVERDGMFLRLYRVRSSAAMRASLGRSRCGNGCAESSSGWSSASVPGWRRTDISNRRPPSTNAVWRLTT
jgi:hypothetical protein